MAVLGRWQDGSVSVVPTTSFAVPTSDLFNTGTPLRNDGSAYALSSSGRLTLPSANLADGYMLIARIMFQDTSNGRVSIAARFQQISGTGNFVNLQTGSYSRNTNNPFTTAVAVAIIDNPSASATFDLQWARRSDTPTGGTTRSILEVIPLFYSDIGMYTGSALNLYGGTTRNIVTQGTTVVEGTNITRSGDIVTVTGDNKRYLILSSQWYRDRGEPSSTRTQRIFGHDYDGSPDLAAQSYGYYRQTSADGVGGGIQDIIETITASRTIEMTCYRGDGVSNGQGGGDLDGQAPAEAVTGLVVIELNDTAEVFRTHDATGLQAIDVTSPVDINAARTTDFIDAASWVKVGTVGMENNKGSAFDSLAGSNLWAASTDVTSGERGSMIAKMTINGSEDLEVFHYNYIRGNQGSEDTFAWAANPVGYVTLADNEDLGVSVEGIGIDNVEHPTDTQAGTVGFWGINLDTMEAASGQTVNSAPASTSLVAVAPASVVGGDLSINSAPAFTTFVAPALAVALEVTAVLSGTIVPTVSEGTIVSGP